MSAFQQYQILSPFQFAFLFHIICVVINTYMANIIFGIKNENENINSVIIMKIKIEYVINYENKNVFFIVKKKKCRINYENKIKMQY